MKRPVWFKRKIYGWGWTPSAWQGWAILGIYTGAIISLIGKAESDSFLSFFLPLLGLTALLLVTTYLTGEKPQWQWGRPKKHE